MRGLFARVFVSVWIAMTLVGAAFVLIERNADGPEHAERRENLFAEALRTEAAEVLDELRAGGDPLPRMREFESRTDAAVFLFMPHDRVVATRAPSDAARQLAQTVREGGNRRREKDSAHLIGFALEEGVVGIGRIRRQTTWTRALGLSTLPSKLAVVLLMSGLVALLLARTLTGPIRRLRMATQRIGGGALHTRVASEVQRGPAEIDALGRDLDAMAARVQALVEGKERLLSDVSHELNSPLARLRVALEIARDRSGPDAKKSLDRIEREATRLGALVEGILAASRAEVGSSAARQRVELASLVQDIVRDASFEARPLDRTVALDAEGAFTLEGDPETLRQGIENVIRNALRFAPEGSAVEVRMRRERSDAVIRVRDHGPGVPDADLEAIFQPLYRVDPDRDRRTGGAGLGLAITARAMRAHGGEVGAANSPEGGLTVTMRLPIDGSAPEPMAGDEAR